MSVGDTILAALRTSCPTASSTTWLGSTPGHDLVFVTRASCITHADLQAMVDACRALDVVQSVRYEVDCGDRAVRVVVALGPTPAPSARPAWLPWLTEVLALAWSIRTLVPAPAPAPV